MAASCILTQKPLTCRISRSRLRSRRSRSTQPLTRRSSTCRNNKILEFRESTGRLTTRRPFLSAYEMVVLEAKNLVAAHEVLFDKGQHPILEPFMFVPD